MELMTVTAQEVCTINKWLWNGVQDHIHSFGGDKDRVTLSGFSAGACSAAMHAWVLLANPHKKTFQNVVLQSGSSELCRRGGVTRQNYEQKIANKYARFGFELVLPDGRFKLPDQMVNAASSNVKLSNSLNIFVGIVKDEFFTFG
uniref:Carboxylic ester hydrolase n=1 Tax=Ditylenchus dipsaci TaxID=166011 RepID=A0A915DE37_9BILA